MIFCKFRSNSLCIASPLFKMAETESVSALAAGNVCASMVQKALSRCVSDDFRRLLSRGLAVGGVAAKLVCGGGVGSGCSERVWRDGEKGLSGSPIPRPPGRSQPCTSFPQPIQRELAAPRPTSLLLDPSPSRRGDAWPGTRPRSPGPPCVCAPACGLPRGVRCGGCAFSQLLLGRGRRGDTALSLQTLWPSVGTMAEGCLTNLFPKLTDSVCCTQRVGREGSSSLCSVLSQLFSFVLLCSVFKYTYNIFSLSQDPRCLIWRFSQPSILFVLILLGPKAEKIGSAEGPASFESDRGGSGVSGYFVCISYFIPPKRRCSTGITRNHGYFHTSAFVF